MFALRNARLANGKSVDVGIDGERIESVGHLPESVDSFDCGGHLLLPAFIDDPGLLTEYVRKPKLGREGASKVGRAGGWPRIAG